MVFFQRPLTRIAYWACLSLAMGLLCGVSGSEAKDGRRGRPNREIIRQLPPLSHDAFEDVIVQLPPLRPVANRPASAADARKGEPPSLGLEAKEQPAGAADTAQDENARRLAPEQDSVAEAAASEGEIQSPAPEHSSGSSPEAQREGKPEQSVQTLTTGPSSELPSPTDQDAQNPAPAPAEEAAQKVSAGQSQSGTPAQDEQAAKPAAQPNAPTEAQSAKPASPVEAAGRIAAIVNGGIKGPATVHLAGRAAYSAPEGRIFLPKEKARELVEAAGHQWDEATVGVILDASSGFDWLAFLDLLDDGYIKDEDLAGLDAAKLLDAYKASVAATNEARLRAGAKPLAVTGWIDPPHYDEKHRLASCVGATTGPTDGLSSGIVNCTSYALGREGGFKIIVATSRDGYEALKGEASRIAENIVFDPGRGYVDVDLATDRIAPYGLASLATGAAPRAKQSAAAIARPNAPEAPASGAHLLDYILLLSGLAGLALLAFRFMKAKGREGETDDAGWETEAAPAGKPSARARAGDVLKAIVRKIRGSKAQSRPEAQADTVSTEETGASDADPANAEEAQSGSVLAKFALLMRQNAPEPTPTVNIDRWRRQQEMRDRAASQDGATLDVRSAVASSPGDGDLGLIEPGHAEAASVAITAQRAQLAARA
jgi:uncharacterized membrane-anchored protein